MATGCRLLITKGIGGGFVAVQHVVVVVGLRAIYLNSGSCLQSWILAW